MSNTNWKYFNCSKQSEHDYIINLYPKENREKVKNTLELWCEARIIDDFTYEQVYDLINFVLNLHEK